MAYFGLALCQGCCRHMCSRWYANPSRASHVGASSVGLGRYHVCRRFALLASAHPSLSIASPLNSSLAPWRRANAGRRGWSHTALDVSGSASESVAELGLVEAPACSSAQSPACRLLASALLLAPLASQAAKQRKVHRSRCNTRPRALLGVSRRSQKLGFCVGQGEIVASGGSCRVGAVCMPMQADMPQ